MGISRGSFVALLSFVACGATARGDTLTFYGLGNLGGFSAFSAFDVSGNGSVVVGAGFDSQHVEHGFRWSTDGTLILFDGETRAVSFDGNVVVGQARFGTATEAFRWTVGTGLVPLGDLPTGQDFSFASGVSADGSTVVGYSDIQDHQRAFRWTATTGMIDLGPVGGKQESWALATSADGTAVVGWGGVAGSVRYEAFRWSSSGGMTRLGYLPGGNFESSANSLSADGSIVVGTSSNGSATVAYRWTQATGMVPLTGIPGTSQARDASADVAVIVGYADSQAMIWTQALGMVRLKDYLISRGVTGLDNWFLRHADAISADGRTIVGEGINPEGQQEAWVATIPEPSTALLAVMGATFAGVVALRRKLR